MPSRDPRPDIFSYLDHRAYLDDWFQWKKEENPRFSHRLFARKAGQRSPSLLLSVIKGKRNLTDATAVAFAGAMQLSEEEEGIFLLLIRLERQGAEPAQIHAQVTAARRALSSVALLRINAEVAEDSAVTVAVPASRLEEVHAALRALQQQLLDLCAGDNAGEDAYRIHLRLPRLSEG